MQRTGLVAGFFAFVAGIAGCANNGGGAQCDPACPTFYECCSAGDGIACRDIVNDPNNCGGCGVVCPSGICREATCVPGTPNDGGVPPTDGSSGGNCRPMCGSTERCCDTTCVSRSGVALGSDGRSDSSFGACNGCGIACSPERASACSVPGGAAMGTPRCMCGAGDQCGVGQICVNQAGTFTCVSTSNDPRNCGAPGNACAMGESCVGGACQCPSTGGACTGGTGCCSSGCVDLMNDVNNCGTCGNRCGANEMCTSGMCTCNGRVCARPMAGIIGGFGGSCGEVCCATGCVPADEANCGACGTACGAGLICGMPFDLGGIGGGGGGAPMVQCLDPDGSGPLPLPPTECGEGGGGFPGLGDGGIFPFP